MQWSPRSILSLFSNDLAIDLGTANTLVYVRGKGIVVCEPSIIAVNQKTGKVEAVGKEAKEMLGRTPGNIIAIRSMKDGVIADFEHTEKMLDHFIKKAHNRSVRIAGNRMDEDIVQYLKRKYNLLVGERTAEEIKINIGSAFPLDEELTMEIKGRDLVEGIPKTLVISDEEIREALSETVSNIIEAVRVALEQTPPELSADIVDKGIVLTGGGSQLKNLDKRLREETGLPVSMADDPQASVVLGTGKMLDDFNLLRKIAID